MEFFRWIGFAAFFIAGLVIGIRLLRLWTHTRELPELLIGIGVLGFGPLGFGLATVARLLPAQSIWAVGAMVAGLLALHIGAASQFWFIALVFRPQQRLARHAAVAVTALLAVTLIGNIAAGGLVERIRGGVWFWIGNLMRLSCLGWGSYESLSYYRMMKRRNHLGLSDPVITNRFLLWGLGGGSAFCGSLLAMSVMFVTGQAVGAIPEVSLAVSGFGLVAAVAMWLAFLPPTAYVRAVEARAKKTTQREYSG